MMASWGWRLWAALLPAVLLLVVSRFAPALASTSASASASASDGMGVRTMLPFCEAGRVEVPPLSWEGDAAEAAPLRPVPRLRQVQALVTTGDRMRNTQGVCWADDEAAYQCSLRQLTTPGDGNGRFVDLGRVYRVQAVPDSNSLNGNCFFGQLTTPGFQLHHANGQGLADAYVGPGKLLPINASEAQQNQQVRLRAYNEEASIMSAQALFTGMYPPSLGIGTVDVLDLFTVEQAFDFLMPNVNECPRLGSLVTEALASAAFATHNQSITEPLKQKLASVLRLAPSEVFIPLVKDCIVSHSCNGFTLPTNFTSELVNEVFAEDYWFHQFLYKYPGYRKLAAGPLLQPLVQNIQAAMNNSTAPGEFLVYTGPERGPVFLLLAGLGVLPSTLPLAGSIALLELYELPPHGPPESTAKSDPPSAGDFAVRLVYNGTAIPIPGCAMPNSKSLCPLPFFLSLAEHYIPTNTDCNEGLEARDSRLYNLATGRGIGWQN